MLLKIPLLFHHPPALSKGGGVCREVGGSVDTGQAGKGLGEHCCPFGTHCNTNALPTPCLSDTRKEEGRTDVQRVQSLTGGLTARVLGSASRLSGHWVVFPHKGHWTPRVSFSAGTPLTLRVHALQPARMPLAPVLV